jgi:hypothetical protein
VCREEMTTPELFPSSKGDTEALIAAYLFEGIETKDCVLVETAETESTEFFEGIKELLNFPIEFFVCLSCSVRTFSSVFAFFPEKKSASFRSNTRCLKNRKSVTQNARLARTKLPM